MEVCPSGKSLFLAPVLKTIKYGSVAEWFKAPVLKTDDPKGP